ncbi:MAG TPA: D-tyrosyl-tRNA(Tyr) deacylase [Candidatus Avamphibacillus intestinigallinarum]|nr:D-tyrosyl-tRNA(Tyr) deacylase [Candidatus Avamphibacillus intestinigallinarum]
MKLVVQRTKYAAVRIDGDVVGEIDFGLMVLVGVTHQDTIEDAKYLVRKLSNLRIFEDDAGKMNLSLREVKGSVLSVSQFTLYGDTRKGRRPSFVNAARPEEAKALYDQFNHLLEEEDIHVETGEFGADMDIEFTNSGPVTLIMDTDE